MQNRNYTEEEIKNFFPPKYECSSCGHKYYSQKNSIACCTTMNPEVKGY